MVRSRFAAGIVALTIGAIGSIGQAFLLRHELVNCLPYKVIDYPNFSAIGNIGVWLVPVIALSLAAIFARRSKSVTLMIPASLSSVLFAVFFRTYLWFSGLDAFGDPDATGDFTVSKAAIQFYSYCGSLTIFGTTIGLLCAIVLAFATKSRKLP